MALPTAIISAVGKRDLGKTKLHPWMAAESKLLALKHVNAFLVALMSLGKENSTNTCKMHVREEKKPG